MCRDVDEYINSIYDGKMTLDEFPGRVGVSFQRVQESEFDDWSLQIHFGKHSSRLSKEERRDIVQDIFIGMGRACILTWDLKEASVSQLSSSAAADTRPSMGPVIIEVVRSERRKRFELSTVSLDFHLQKALRFTDRLFCMKWRPISREHSISQYLEANETNCINRRILQVLSNEVDNALIAGACSNSGRSLDELLSPPWRLNNSQKKAFERESLRELQLIHGPPGRQLVFFVVCVCVCFPPSPISDVCCDTGSPAPVGCLGASRNREDDGHRSLCGHLEPSF